MRFAEVSVPGVRQRLHKSSSIICAFSRRTHPFLLEDAHDKEAPMTSYREGLR